jgi:DNA-binding Lrp family transcriptional regulator
MDELQRRLINRYQADVPLLERPYQHMAQQLDTTESTVMNSLRGLLNDGSLTRFGPLYDAARLGGGLTLAAISVPEQRYKEVCDSVNRFTEVAHNYRREHQFNMWFVLATEKPEQLQQTLDAIATATGLEVYNFPKQHEFYIGLQLQLSADGKHQTVPVDRRPVTLQQPYRLNQLDRNIIQASQSGLPLETTPYRAIADSIGSNQSEVLLRMKSMLMGGIIRRIGVVPNHYKLGIRANGMSVWDIDDGRVIEIGEAVGQLDFVSHCYQRPRHLPLWPYNLFAMVHGHSREEVVEKVERISALIASDCNAHDTLFSTAILKKTGLRLAA